ncbi:MAG: ribonuclease HI [Cyclobacteriaceae bacterium]|nr:ribonuclease HI [Cyclobacteriaceae bacterium]
MINIYTDGAAQGNPGPGGYGVVMKFNQHVKEFSEGFRLTTNNRMELLAVIVALEAIKKENIPVTVYSDSKYVVEAVEQGWIWNWEKKNFAKKANEDLWRRFIPLYHTYKPKFKWIKGHAGHPENERCDALAVQAAQNASLQVDTWYENNRDLA